MKISISQDNIQRKIEGTFDICLSGTDALRIIDILKEKVFDHNNDPVPGFFGWIRIYDRPDSNPNKLDHVSKPWKE